jgi:hypothetical protein
MTPGTDPWSFFDTIYCISIDTRIDRRDEAKRQFESCGFLDRVEFVLVSKHPHNQEEGIFQSHMQCLAQGLEAGAQHILIFEDDILLKNFNGENLLRATAHLQKSPSWQAFFLGAICTRIQKTSEPALNAIRYRCLAHGYAVNRPFAEHLLQQTWSHVPYDTLLQKQCKDFFAISPMIAYQSSASTDNQTMILDRFRRLFGGLPLIQRGSAFYQTHKGVFITLHLLFLALLLFLWIK